ncbi:hypothetical protein [Mucilaginibacter arboris]|uniref:Sensor of ECF-type sigma factor n=1 Tax=Mucilaginibacter arboris TaxID=2682090 RepID=A0A7K1SUF1_9SPHI|nr:hypothetical protein [Mucilaginibacter arboris]MVN20951.1 hypothetical protein [Mucilaginibacter arboris]
MNAYKVKMIKKLSIGIGLVLIALFGKAEWTVAQSFRAPGRSMDTRSNFSNSNIDNTVGMHKIESIKFNYLSENMHLNSDEADKFWPLYNQYQKELTVLLHQKRQNMLNSQKNPQDIVNDNLDYDSKILAVKKHYNEEFSRILPPDKLMHLYKSERLFNDEMIKRLKNRKDDNN